MSTPARKPPPRRTIRTCPLCGQKGPREGLYGHLLEYHENDARDLAWHLNRALESLLNGARRQK